MAFFGLLNLWAFHRFHRPLLPLVAALFVSFFAFFLSPVMELVVFLAGQTLAFYAGGKSR